VPPDIKPDRWQQHYGVFLPDQTTPLPVDQFPLFRAIHGEDVSESEYFLKNPAWPEGLWISASASPLHDETGAVIGGVVTVRDINFRKEAAEAVRRSESRLRAIVETAYDAIITFDERSIVEGCNAAAERIFGYAAEELIGQALTILMESPFREEFEAELAGLRRTGKEPLKGASRELMARRRDGSTFPIDLSVSEFRHGTGRLFTAIIRDVSERRAFQEKLLSIAEEEQRRIGQDLHDDIGQELTGLALKAETLAEIIALGKGPDTGIARGIVADLDRTRKKLRLLARGLVPVEVDSQGLTAALLDLTKRLGEVNGVSCVLECQGSALVEHNRVATQLYHIAQEAIANAIKHGQARAIKVLLETRENRTRLEIRDDGRGLPRKLKRGLGTGLQIMSYRAGLLGGKLTLSQAKPRGTVVACLLNGGIDHDSDTKPRT
jgi:two-component system CheB/CheR fusion protein